MCQVSAPHLRSVLFSSIGVRFSYMKYMIAIAYL